ncbi:hypothetical protein EI94DRAFT_673622 [Lactarius quietus]|nr:hypothetical protein EI94DRAFT_673622 [Lactarius quietus]
MLLALCALLLIAAPLADVATPRIAWHNTRVKHTWHVVPTNWESLGHPPSGTAVDLYIALRPNRESALIDDEASKARPPPQSQPQASTVTPHPFRYGSNLSKEQVAELVMPYPETLV